VTAKRKSRDPLFDTMWVHVFEQDTAAGAVYRPEDSSIPLSRRPRERLRLSANGSARLFAGGPDDRLTERAATWCEEDAVLVVRADDGGTVLRVVERSAERLVVRTGASRARR
jgi:hypothetical protein